LFDLLDRLNKLDDIDFDPKANDNRDTIDIVIDDKSKPNAKTVVSVNNIITNNHNQTQDPNSQLKSNAITMTGLICDICDNDKNLIEDTANGIIVCENCGLVISVVFDCSDESAHGPNDDGKPSVSRCGNITNYFLPQTSLGTTIACSNKSKVKILHGWGLMPYKERSLNRVLKKIHRKCQEAHIVKYIEDDAKILYKNIMETKYKLGENKGKNIIIRGINRKSLIAACVFYACKRKQHTRSPKEIARLFNMKYKDMTRGCKIFSKLISMNKMQYDIQISDPMHFIMRFCRDLHINNDNITRCIQIANNIQQLKLASMHTPFSIATGSIMLTIIINKLNIDKKDVAKQFGVSDVTIQKTYKKIVEYKMILVNDQLTKTLSTKIELNRKLVNMPPKLVAKYNSIIKNELIEQYNRSIKHKFLDTMGYISDMNNWLNTQIQTTNNKYKEIQSVGPIKLQRV